MLLVVGRRSGEVTLLDLNEISTDAKVPTELAVAASLSLSLPSPSLSLALVAGSGEHQGQYLLISACLDSKLYFSCFTASDGAFHEIAVGRRAIWLEQEGFTFSRVTVDHTSRMLATVGNDFSIHFWNIQRLWSTMFGADESCKKDLPSHLFDLPGHTATISCLAFSKNDALIVSGSRDHTLNVWECLSGKRIHSLIGHSAPVTCACFSPRNETIIASGSSDFLVLVWRDGVCEKKLQQHSYGVSAVLLDDFDFLASASKDKTICFQPLSSLSSSTAVLVCSSTVLSLTQLNNKIVAGLGDGSIVDVDPCGVTHIVVNPSSDSVWSLAVVPNSQQTSVTSDVLNSPRPSIFDADFVQALKQSISPSSQTIPSILSASETFKSFLKRMGIDKYESRLSSSGFRDISSLSNASMDELVGVGIPRAHALNLILEFGIN